MKNKFLFTILVLIIGISIGVGASTLLNSNQVLYKNDKTVEEAINDLYVKSNIGTATASDIKAGKTALVGGKEITGSLTCPTCPSYTSLSGTQSVGAGSSSTLLNGLYNLSNYRVSCGTNSCSACNSCCPSTRRSASGNFTLYYRDNNNGSNTVTVNFGFTPSKFLVYRYRYSDNAMHVMYLFDRSIDSAYYRTGNGSKVSVSSTNPLVPTYYGGNYFTILSTTTSNANYYVYWYAIE